MLNENILRLLLENTEKPEIACGKQFLLTLQYFQKILMSETLDKRLVAILFAKINMEQ